MSRENALSGRMALVTRVSRRKDIGSPSSANYRRLGQNPTLGAIFDASILLPALRASSDERSGDGLGMFRSLGLDDP